MHENPLCFHNLEWPAPGRHLRGPVVWLQGWVVGKPGHDFCDVRVRTSGQSHLGVLGLPRRDLATHFGSARDWLPAGFVVGVPVTAGATVLSMEAQDSYGQWHPLQELPVTIAVDGEPSPRPEGKLIPRPGGSWTVRSPHLPFHGHLDETPAGLIHGRAHIFGWLLHEQQALAAVFATSDLLVFNHLSHHITDDALGGKVPLLPQARHSRLKGEVNVPPSLANPACLRLYAQLADGSVHLCFVQRLAPPPARAAAVAAPTKAGRPAAPRRGLPDLPSGRPRRLLLSTLNLWPDDATLRALDVGRYLVATHRWAVRLITTADGPLRGAFEAAGIAVQVVDPLLTFAAGDSAAIEKSIAHLGRQIWWQHLEAAAVFDPGCFWAVTLARHHRLPVLFDCSSDETLGLPHLAPSAVTAAMLSGWKSASLICYPSRASARRQAELLGARPDEIVPHWTSVTAISPRQPCVVAPIGGASAHGAAVLLQAGDWLARRHPEFPWRIAVTDLRSDKAGHLFAQDAAFNRPAIMTLKSVAVTSAAACVCPAFSGHPIRALLDAAAAGVPIVSTFSPAVEDIFSPSEAALVPAGHPLALAHALADLTANPSAAARRAERARTQVLAHHAAPAALARWQAALEGMVAAGS